MDFAKDAHIMRGDLKENRAKHRFTEILPDKEVLTMTNLQNFIEAHRSEILGPKAVPSRDEAAAMLASLELYNAKELERYLSTYGWLSYRSVRFYGMGDGSSDMLDETVRLRSARPACNGYAALEDLGGGLYALCDGHGRVFRLDCGVKSLTDLHMQLEEYILSRFLEENKMQ